MVAACPFPTYQGTQVLIRHLASALAYAGHEVHLITYGYGEYEADFPFHLHRSAKVGDSLRSGPNLKKPAADAALMLTAARVIKAHRCDLLHVHNIEGLGIGAVLKLQTSIPMVYHAHNAMGPELPTYFKAHLAQAFASVVGDVIDKTLPRTADAVVVFDEDHRSLHEVHGISANRIHVIAPGLLGEELSGSCPQTTKKILAEIGEGPWLLYAGNPDAYQNLPLLWESFQKVRVKRPDLKLLVASNCDTSAFEDELEAASSRDGVYLYRYNSILELCSLFSIAQLGVCPRNLWTGAPIKLLNYISVGLPVVACKAAGRHIVGNSCGKLVNPNSDEFSSAILEVLQSMPSRQSIRRRYNRFRIESQIDAYEEVYRSVLSKNLPVTRAPSQTI